MRTSVRTQRRCLLINPRGAQRRVLPPLLPSLLHAPTFVIRDFGATRLPPECAEPAFLLLPKGFCGIFDARGGACRQYPPPPPPP